MKKLHVWLTVVAAIATVAGAVVYTWTCDDAFVSFRYAEQLVAGNGLVFNPGERVEGYSNFLWTLWCALGLWIGADVELWAHGLSIASMAAVVGLLGWLHARLQRRSLGGSVGGWSVPLAAVAVAGHRELLIYATSGLETALYTALIIGAFAILVAGQPSIRRLLMAGVVLGIAALTRPDAPLIAGVCGLWLVWRLAGEPDMSHRRGFVLLAVFSAGFAAFWLPHTGFRWLYYGDVVPNTAHAKSAHLSWWSQGLTYVGMYVRRYPLLAVGPALLMLRAARRVTPLATRPDLVLAAVLPLVYSAYVARVGGDFMFGRFLVPVTPLLLWSLQGELTLILRGRSAPLAVAAAVVLAAQVLAPSPVPAEQVVSGIADEWSFYRARPPALGGQSVSESMRGMGRTLRPFLKDLPVRIAIVGSQAQLAWESRARYVLEANGLTDATIAHQPLEARGRPGHEKHPTFEYVVQQRAVHFAFSPTVVPIVRGRIPLLKARFSDVVALLLTWDEALYETLRARGAELPDYLAQLDAEIAGLSGLPAQARRRRLAMHDAFYFSHNRDPLRRARFVRALSDGANAP